MLSKLKELIALIAGTRLQIQGTGRTFAEAPMWLVVLAAVASPHLAVITALLVVAFGMRASIMKA